MAEINNMKVQSIDEMEKKFFKPYVTYKDWIAFREDYRNLPKMSATKFDDMSTEERVISERRRTIFYNAARYAVERFSIEEIARDPVLVFMWTEINEHIDLL